MIPNRNIFQHSIRGFKNIPHCGPHPGVPIFFFLVVITSLYGLNNGIVGVTIGFFLSITFYLPIIIIGSIKRSKFSDKFELKRIEKIENILFN